MYSLLLALYHVSREGGLADGMPEVSSMLEMNT